MAIKALREDIRTAADPEIAKHSARLFKTGPGEYGESDIFLGVRVPVIRKLVKKHMPLAPKALFVLLQSRYHEERLAALVGLVTLFEAAQSEIRQSIYNQYLKHTRYINNWDLVDGSAHQIIGGQLFDKDKAPLYRLASSKNLWERRVAIIATFHLIKHNQFKDTLRLSRLLLSDPEDLIHKAVGWMLREVGKRDQAAEERFLREHYRNMPRTMLRYAIEKFPNERRMAYLKGEV